MSHNAKGIAINIIDSFNKVDDGLNKKQLIVQESAQQQFAHIPCSHWSKNTHLQSTIKQVFATNKYVILNPPSHSLSWILSFVDETETRTPESKNTFQNFHGNH